MELGNRRQDNPVAIVEDGKERSTGSMGRGNDQAKMVKPNPSLVAWCLGGGRALRFSSHACVEKSGRVGED